MKTILTTALIFASFAGFSQVTYIGYTYNYIKPVDDSLQVNLTTNYQVGLTTNTIDCTFNVGKNKTWTQLEAIFETKSQDCFNDLIGN